MNALRELTALLCTLAMVCTAADAFLSDQKGGALLGKMLSMAGVSAVMAFIGGVFD